MKNDDIRYISEFKDFIELVEEFMGYDCKRYAEENLHDEVEWEALQDEVEHMEEEISDLKDKLKGGD